jgi:hypothetical protein
VPNDRTTVDCAYCGAHVIVREFVSLPVASTITPAIHQPSPKKEGHLKRLIRWIKILTLFLFRWVNRLIHFLIRWIEVMQTKGRLTSTVSAKTILLIGFVGLLIVLGIIGAITEERKPKPEQSIAAANANASVSTPQPMLQETERVVITVPTLMRKSPAAFEKLFSTPTEITEWMQRGNSVGEIRRYAIPGTRDGLRVDFYQGKAASMLLTLDSAGKCGGALRMLNINYSNTAPCEQQPNFRDMKCVYFADKFGSPDTIQGRICAEFYKTGPSGWYQILLQVDTPATKEPLS